MTLIHFYRFSLLITIFCISYLAFTPADLSAVFSVSDKVLHALAFLVLFLLVDFSWPGMGLGRGKWFGLMAYGVFIEVVQSFIPYRDGSILDLLADGLGMSFYALIYLGLNRVALYRVLRSSGSV